MSSPAITTRILGSISEGTAVAFSCRVDNSECSPLEDLLVEHSSMTRAIAMRIPIAPRPPKRYGIGVRHKFAGFMFPLFLLRLLSLPACLSFVAGESLRCGCIYRSERSDGGGRYSGDTVGFGSFLCVFPQLARLVNWHCVL